jgi:hypothetical protein
MSLPETLILVLYFFVLSILAIYGWHRYYLVYLYMRNRGRAPEPLPALTVLPPVTIQLPIFNEMYVADRLIDAVCEMDYPKALLEIQVLDDSTDETREIAELAVRRHAARGFNIRYLHRVDRRGYKAGALEAGLQEASGHFVAIFDADFIPSRDFLQRTLPHCGSDPTIGMVQARPGPTSQSEPATISQATRWNEQPYSSTSTKPSAGSPIGRSTVGFHPSRSTIAILRPSRLHARPKARPNAKHSGSCGNPARSSDRSVSDWRVCASPSTIGPSEPSVLAASNAESDAPGETGGSAALPRSGRFTSRANAVGLA